MIKSSFHKRIISLIILLSLSISVLVTSIFAWFAIGSNITKIIVLTGKLDMEVNLFSTKDFNRDGIIDVDLDFLEIFDPADEIIIENLKIGDIVTYKLIMVNQSDVTGVMKLTLDNINGGASISKIRDVIIVTSYNKNNKQETIQSTYIGGTGEIIFYVEDNVLPFQNKEIIIQFRFATLEELISANPALFLNKTNVNEYQNLTLTVGILYVNLEQSL